MKKTICDICGCEADKRIKAKNSDKILNRDGTYFWTFYKKIDMCDKCYKTIKKLRYEKDLEERVSETLVKGCFEEYSNPDRQSDYLQGVQDALDQVMLMHKMK